MTDDTGQDAEGGQIATDAWETWLKYQPRGQENKRSVIMYHGKALLFMLTIYALLSPFIIWLFFTLMRMLGLVEGAPW